MQWVHGLKSKGSFLYHDIIQHKSKKSPRIAFNKQQVESAPLNWGAMQRLPCSAAVYKGVIPWWSPLSMSADASSKECRMSRCPFLEWARISESRTCHAFCFAINWVELHETLVSWAFRGELHLTYEGIWSILESPRAFAGEIERHPSGMYDIMIYYVMFPWLYDRKLSRQIGIHWKNIKLRPARPGISPPNWLKTFWQDAGYIFSGLSM